MIKFGIGETNQFWADMCEIKSDLEAHLIIQAGQEYKSSASLSKSEIRAKVEMLALQGWKTLEKNISKIVTREEEREWASIFLKGARVFFDSPLSLQRKLEQIIKGEIQIDEGSDQEFDGE